MRLRALQNAMSVRITSAARVHLERKGGDRVRQTIRQSLTVVANVTAREGTRARAYTLLSNFL